MSLLCKPKTFSEAFPNVFTLEIAVRIKKGGTLDGNPRVSYFSNSRPPGEYIACGRTGCTGNGWNIGDALREMVTKRETERNTGGICDGQERMSRSNYRSCLCLFEADIKLTYSIAGTASTAPEKQTADKHGL